MRIRIQLLILFIFSFGAAAAKPFIRAGGEDVSIDSEGIKFNTIKASTANPIAFPDARIYSSLKDPSIKFELFNINELWIYEQVLGRWYASSGSMIFAKIKLSQPENVKKTFDNLFDYVKKEDFQDWVKSTDHKVEGEDDTLKWLETFAACKVKKDDAFKSKKAKMDIRHYVCDDPYKDLYYVAGPETPKRKFVILFQMERSADIKKSMKNIPSIINTFSLFAPKKENDDKRLVTRKTANIKDRSPEYLESRDKVIANIKNLGGWWYIETENYVFTANLTNRKLIDEMQLQIEKCRSIYEKYFELKSPLRKISVVKSFNSRDEYLKYLDDKASFSIGMWSPSKEELIISPVSENRKENREQMVKILYHEGFHQYIFYASDMISAAPWFNEGHASFFEGLEFKGNNFKLDPKARLSEFERCGGTSKSAINDLLQKDYPQFYDKNTFPQNYASAWGLIYFLNKGAPVMGKFEYAAIPLKYYQALHDLKDPEKATAEAWKNIDMDAFAADMIKFFNSKKYMKKAEKYDFMKNKELLNSRPENASSEKSQPQKKQPSK